MPGPLQIILAAMNQLSPQFYFISVWIYFYAVVAYLHLKLFPWLNQWYLETYFHTTSWQHVLEAEDLTLNAWCQHKAFLCYDYVVYSLYLILSFNLLFPIIEIFVVAISTFQYLCGSEKLLRIGSPALLIVFYINMPEILTANTLPEEPIQSMEDIFYSILDTIRSVHHSPRIKTLSEIVTLIVPNRPFRFTFQERYVNC